MKPKGFVLGSIGFAGTALMLGFGYSILIGRAAPEPTLPGKPETEQAPQTGEPPHGNNAVAPQSSGQMSTLNVTFEEREAVSTSKVLSEPEKKELKRFVFPPLHFHWSARPQALAPAFIWERQDGTFLLGDAVLESGRLGERTLSGYSGSLAIRLDGTAGLLRMHLNAVSRLRAWVLEIEPHLGEPKDLVLELEPLSDGRVAMRVPQVGPVPARVFEVGL